MARVQPWSLPSPCLPQQKLLRPRLAPVKSGAQGASDTQHAGYTRHLTYRSVDGGSSPGTSFVPPGPSYHGHLFTLPSFPPPYLFVPAGCRGTTPLVWYLLRPAPWPDLCPSYVLSPCCGKAGRADAATADLLAIALTLGLPVKPGHRRSTQLPGILEG